jgi:hypothetical protein
MGPGGSHGLQNRCDLSPIGWVGSIPTRSRRLRLRERLLFDASAVGRRGTAGLLLLLAVVSTLSAQQQDSTRAGVSRPAQTHRAPRVDTVKGPPIPPGRAFLYSLLVPGLGQAKLDRAWTGALFAGVEVLALSRWEQAARDLKYAQTHRNDSIALYDSVVNGVVQINDTTGKPIEIFAYNPYTSARIGARKVHVEDWIAVIIFNHLISGADAFVEAQLWDLPSRISAFRAPDGSTVVAISLPIRAPPL